MEGELSLELREVFKQALDARLFSGAQLGVLDAEGGASVWCFGQTAFAEHAPPGVAPTPVDAATRFDVASVTKAVVTAPLLWSAVATGAATWDAPVGRWLPEWADAGRGVTLGQLANHTAGLPAWLPLWEATLAQDLAGLQEHVRAEVLRTAPEATPGTRALYSDLGYMLLGFALERMLGAPLDRLAEALIFAPLGMTRARFVRHGAGEGLDGAVAATEITALARWGASCSGQVHDENGWALGGVAGHAGLFAAADDLLRFARAVLAADGGEGDAWTPGRALVRWMLSPCGATRDSDGARLGSHVGGFDTPSGAASTAGPLWSREPVGAGIGHLGFTGTSLWIDRPRRLAVALLTNRVHPSRAQEGMGAFRAEVHRLIAAAHPVRGRVYAPAPLLGGDRSGPVARLAASGRRELEVAVETAQRAGELARAHFARGEGLRRSLKGEVDLVTDADVEVQRLIVERLRSAFPGHGIVAEEDELADTSRACTWIVDPIDGTTNFSHGLPHFAILLALEVDGALQLGVTLDPMRGELFWATRGGGAWLNGRRLRASPCPRLGDALAVTGFPYDRRTAQRNNIHHFAAMLRKVQGGRRMGSAGLDLAWVAAGRLDLYWELRLKYWDVAAGLLLVDEAGGLVTRFDGAPPDRSADEIVATGGLIHAEVLDALAAVDAALAREGVGLDRLV